MLGEQPPRDLEGLFVAFGKNNYRHAPSIDTNANWGSGAFSVHTDALGFRCDKNRAFAAHGDQAIDFLIVGDSQGYGQGLDFEDSVAGAFALVAKQSGFRACNASVGGHYLSNQMEIVQWLLEDQGVRVRNIIVLLTPYLIATADRLNAVSVDSKGRLYRGRVSLSNQVILWIKTHTVLYTKIRDAMRAIGLGPKQEALTDVVRWYQAGQLESDATLKLSASIRHIRDLASKNGAGVFMVYSPLVVEIEEEALSRAASARGTPFDLNVPWRISSTTAEVIPIPIHNLKPSLIGLRSKGQLLSLKGDPHYNGITSKACAEDMWKFIYDKITSS
jgi:hypothetical protein